MNQFHTPSFGDEVFEMNDTPIEPTTNPNTSRRISRLSSLDHVDDAEEEQQMDYETTLSTNQTQQQHQQQQPQPQLLATSQQSEAPAKPLAPFALFFRDTMTAIKQQNPACTLEKITAIVHNMWDSMDSAEKTVYERRHEMDKRLYMVKLRDYQRQQQEQLQQPLDESPNVAEEEQQQQETSGTSQAPTATVAVIDADAVKDVATAAAATAAVEAPSQPEHNQLLNEAAAVQKCTRELCNKPAIINPDWEDEYCSNECVVIHCRNVFNEWARALQYSPP